MDYCKYTHCVFLGLLLCGCGDVNDKKNNLFAGKLSQGFQTLRSTKVSLRLHDE
jgi:hypothetical protein